LEAINRSPRTRKRREEKKEKRRERWRRMEGDFIKECGRLGVKGRALAPETNGREGGP